MMLEETGRKRILAPLPFPLASLMGMFCEIAAWAPFITPPLTRDQVKLLEHDNVISNDPSIGTLADLGIAPQTVESILPSYMVRYRKYGQFTERAA